MSSPRHHRPEHSDRRRRSPVGSRAGSRNTSRNNSRKNSLTGADDINAPLTGFVFGNEGHEETVDRRHLAPRTGRTNSRSRSPLRRMSVPQLPTTDEILSTVGNRLEQLAEPLLAGERRETAPTPPPSFGRRVWNSFIRLVPKTLLSTAISIPTAVQGIIGVVKGSVPSDLLKRSFWKRLTVGQKFHAVGNGAASFGINIVLNLYYLPKAYHKLIHIFRNFRDDKYLNTASVWFAMWAAISSVEIAYESDQWVPEKATLNATIAYSFAMLNFIGYFGTRFCGDHDLLEALTKETTTQAEWVEMLKRINPSHLDNVSELYQDTVRPIFSTLEDAELPTRSEIGMLTEELATRLARYIDRINEISELELNIQEAHENTVILPTPRGEKIKQSLGLALDVATAAPIGIVATLLFMQKSADSFKDLFHLTIENDWIKRLIGIMAGLGSGGLYAYSAFKLRRTVLGLVEYLKENQSTVTYLTAAVLLTADIVSESGMENVARNIINREDNIVFMDNDRVGDLFIVLAAIGGTVVNTVASIKWLAPEPTASTAYFREGLNNYINYVSKIHDNRLAPDTLTALRANTIFTDRVDDRRFNNELEEAERGIRSMPTFV